MVLPRGDDALTDRLGHLPCPGCQHGTEEGQGGEGGGGTELVGGEGSTCHLGQGGYDDICDGQAESGFSGAVVMASAFISPFHQSARICVTDHKPTFHLFLYKIDAHRLFCQGCIKNRFLDSDPDF